MASISTFYYSRIRNLKVVNTQGNFVGEVEDVVVDIEQRRPKVIAITLKTAEGVQEMDAAGFQITKQDGQYQISCENLHPCVLNEETTVHIGQSILNRKIVDIDGRQLVHVHDLRLAMLSDGIYLIAVDVGLEGKLRRLGIAKPLKKFLKVFGLSIPTHYILWDDVETIDFGNAKIKLSKTNSNLNRLHPADLADIIEDMDLHTQVKVFSSLDNETAADVLEELEPDAQITLLEQLPVEKAADLLEIMPADEVADILDEMHEHKAEALLNEMENEASEDVRELMDYPDNVVGSIMSTDYLCFSENNTVNDVLKELRRLKPEPDEIYYLYIINHVGKLLSTVSIRDLLVSEPETELSEIMIDDLVKVYDTDKIDTINEVIAKYSLLAVPVVDEHENLLGMVVINDVMHNLLRARRKRL